ncbi:PREDICTED: uncharacterized protein LOC109226198 [Nicotiana attenuata]|uniref:uncharacterized protein LOC109226198 n=1 Tax=Nicotiana attenuata TaxID=49451 RepID=UPI00090554A3|nr:PREDICTED: uncharacterized protein LOC109226198 [Nicotiana attenuata]
MAAIFFVSQNILRTFLVVPIYYRPSQFQTPISLKLSLHSNDSPSFSDPTLYSSLVGGLQYLTFTRPDIAFAVNQVSQFMHSPLDIHYTAVKQILRYLHGTLNHGLFVAGGSLGSLQCYTDADWAGCPTTRRSTSAYSNVVLRSSAEAEYRSVAHAAAELTCTIYLAHNPVQHARTKHIEIDVHFVREKVASGTLQVQYVPSQDQLADLLTKAVPSPRLLYLRDKLYVLSDHASLEGE